MGDILRRRAMMAKAADPASDWDFVWDYTKGLPGANGLIKDVQGTLVTERLDTDGLYLAIRAPVTKNKVHYRYSNNYTKSVMEVKFRTSASTATRGYIALSANGVDGVSVMWSYSTQYKGIYLCDSSSEGSMTKLESVALSTEYTVRLVLNDGYADVYINDVLQKQDVDISTLYYGDSTQYSFYNPNTGGTGLVNTKLIYIKLKLGRI